MMAVQRQLALDPGLAPHLAVKLLTKPGMRLTTTIDSGIYCKAAGIKPLISWPETNLDLLDMLFGITSAHISGVAR